MSRKPTYITLFLSAVLVRSVYILSVAGDPTFLEPVVDSAAYRTAAESFAAGSGLTEGALRFGPLYPMLLALLLRITGGAPLALHLAQIILTSTAVPLLAALGAKVFNRTVGAIAGLIALFYWPWIYFDGELLVEPVLIPLLLLLAWLLLRAEEKGSRSGVLAAGLVMGLCAITRPNALLLLPAWLVYYAVRRRWSNALFLLIGCLLPILPVTARNQTASGEWVLISSTGGINFFIGNNERATGRDSTFPGMTQWTFDKIHLLAEEETGRELGASDVSRFYLAKGLRFFTTNPAAAVSLTGHKLVQLFSSYEMPNVKDPNFHRLRSWFLGFPLLLSFGVIAPLALAGLFTGRGAAHGRSLLLLITVYTISVLLFFVNGRYRIPIVPFIILFAAAGLVELASWRRGRAAFRILPAGALIAGLLMVNWNPLGAVTDNSQSHFNVGWAAQKRGDFTAALAEYDEVQKGNRWYPLALNNKALIFRDTGRIGDAKSALEEALDIDPTYFEGWATLGSIQYRLLDFIGAAGAYRKAIALWPGKAAYHVNLGLALRNQSDFEGALLAFDNALSVDGDYTGAKAHRTDMLIALDRMEEAIPDLEAIVHAEPENLAARHHLAVAYHSVNRVGEARVIWEEIVRTAPGSGAANEAGKRLAGVDDDR